MKKLLILPALDLMDRDKWDIQCYEQVKLQVVNSVKEMLSWYLRNKLKLYVCVEKRDINK